LTLCFSMVRGRGGKKGGDTALIQALAEKKETVTQLAGKEANGKEGDPQNKYYREKLPFLFWEKKKKKLPYSFRNEPRKNKKVCLYSSVLERKKKKKGENLPE